MIIRELYIKNFGKFSEQHFYLHDGLQVISGENEEIDDPCVYPRDALRA